MDPKTQWQALQSTLTTARALFQAGDRARALEQVDQALAIDPQFLAAQTLRQQILSAVPVVRPTAVPLVSVEGYRRFEERARRRRADRRVEAARTAIALNKLRDASAAIDELRELDPNLPEIAALSTALQHARLSVSRPHAGSRFFATTAFVVMVFTATWLHDPEWLPSRPMVASAPVAAGTEPAPLPLADLDAETNDTVATIGIGPIEPRDRVADTSHASGVSADPVPAGEVARTTAPSAIRAAASSPVRAAAPPASVSSVEAAVDTSRRFDPPTTPAVAPAVNAAPAAVPPPVVAATRTPPALLPATAPVALPTLPVESATASRQAGPAATTDQTLVNQTLDQYRHAYDGLDAQSARAVWPAVNEAALARAFDELVSQRLTFDACNVELRGESATATCRGTARYVPKVGSHDPRVEPRVWNFVLHKQGPEWKIQSARAQR